MATLEIHDGLGRVQFVTLSRDHPLLFGASSTCDVVLAGNEIKPVHGRIRWRSNRFKIEASPDAEYVLVNGQRAANKSLRQGDEIVVGQCRMFLQGSVSEAEDDRPEPDDNVIDLRAGRTVVISPPPGSPSKRETSSSSRKGKHRQEERPRHNRSAQRSRPVSSGKPGRVPIARLWIAVRRAFTRKPGDRRVLERSGRYGSTVASERSRSRGQSQTRQGTLRRHHPGAPRGTGRRAGT